MQTESRQRSSNGLAFGFDEFTIFEWNECEWMNEKVCPDV